MNLHLQKSFAYKYFVRHFGENCNILKNKQNKRFMIKAKQKSSVLFYHKQFITHFFPC